MGYFEHLATFLSEEVSHYNHEMMVGDRGNRAALVIVFKYKQVKDRLCASLLY